MMQKKVLLLSMIVLCVSCMIARTSFADDFLSYEFLFELGLQSFDQGDYQEAIGYFKKAHLVNPHSKEPERYIRMSESAMDKDLARDSARGPAVASSAEVKQLQASLQKQLDQLLVSQSSARTFTDQVQELIAQHRQTMAELSALRSEKQGLSAQIEMLQREVASLKDARGQQDDLQKKNTQLQEQNKILHERDRVREEKIEDLQAEVSDFERIKKTNIDLAAAKADLTQQLQQLQARVLELEPLVEETETLKDYNRKLGAENRDLESYIDKVHLKLEERKSQANEIVLLQKEQAHLLEQKQDLDRRLAKVDQERYKTAQEAAQAKVALATMKTEKKNIEQDLAAAQKEVEKLSATIDHNEPFLTRAKTVRQARDQLEKEKAQLERELEKEKNRYEKEINKEKNRYEKEINKAQGSLAKVHKQAERIPGLEKDIAQLKQEIKSLNRTIERKEEELRKADERQKDLEATVQSYQDKEELDRLARKRAAALVKKNRTELQRLMNQMESALDIEEQMRGN